jgi:hypothetical protein
MASLTVEVPGELHRGLFFVQLPQVRDAMASLTVEVPGELRSPGLPGKMDCIHFEQAQWNTIHFSGKLNKKQNSKIFG